MKVLIKAGIGILNFFYRILRFLPQKKKILYISRQMDEPNDDFLLIEERMRVICPEYGHVMLCKRLKPGLGNGIRYCFHMLVQMYHLATASAVLLDSYCIAVSTLKHRENLLVIQLWHALGALKKFGYSILDKPEGKSSRVAELMKMHCNYTYVFTSSQMCAPFFSEAFHQPADKVRSFPLPRVDLLLDSDYQEKTRERILKRYPFLSDEDKKVIVYSPTFRVEDRQEPEGLQRLIEEIDFERFQLIVKLHPLTHVSVKDERVVWDEEFSSSEMFAAADYVISDYSAILLEAMLQGKQVYLYAYDYDRYSTGRDFYIDFKSVFSDVLYESAEELMGALEEDRYDHRAAEVICRQMVRPTDVGYTKEICDFILSELRDISL